MLGWAPRAGWGGAAAADIKELELLPPDSGMPDRKLPTAGVQQQAIRRHNVYMYTRLNGA